MTTDLREQLEELADGLPPVRPPDDLWSRGRRRQRRTRAVTTVVTLVAVLVVTLGGVLGSEWLRTAAPQPVAGRGRAAVPDRLETPSPRLPGTDEAGPIGPLAVIAGAERVTSWWGGTGNGLVGVSATTGEYRFLDLPDLAATDVADPLDVSDPVLSPDGRRVGYWFGDADHPERVAGFAVYDTVTGDVSQQAVATKQGLYVQEMAWVDEDTLLLTYGQVVSREGDQDTGSVGGRGFGTWLWRPGGTPQRIRTGADVLGSVVSTGGGRFVLSTGLELEWRDLASGERTRQVGLPDAAAGEADAVGVDPTGRTVVALPQTATGSAGRLLVGTVAGEESTTFRPAPLDVSVFDVVGWSDWEHVLLRGAHGSDAAVYAVDVRTGTHRLLVAEDRDRWGQFPDYATDLWAAGTVSRPAPDHVTDPRLTAVGAGLGALALAGVALAWRRRRGSA